ncbi:malate synthase A, partial [mine drainage metagenome]
EEGVRRNARVSFLYLESWLRGIGCVPIDHLMEDAATAEIARSELWYWIHHSEPLDGGGAVDGALFRRHLAAEVADLRSAAPRGGDASSISRAAEILDRAVTSPEMEEFITTVAYAALADPP